MSNSECAADVCLSVRWNLLLALVVLVPSLAQGGAPDASFTAVDFAWRANDSDATTLTVAPGATVTFAYPAGSNFHNVSFTATKPSSCTGLPPVPRAKGWQGECTFADPGTYAFVCGLHPAMTGSVIVEAPPVATAEATAAPTATPIATPPPAQTTLVVKLAAKQKGTSVRGSVVVLRAGSRLEVTLSALGRRVGRRVVASTASGAVAFSVPLDARARRGLRHRHRLVVRVTVALTPLGATTVIRHARAALRPR